MPGAMEQEYAPLADSSMGGAEKEAMRSIRGWS